MLLSMQHQPRGLSQYSPFTPSLQASLQQRSNTVTYGTTNPYSMDSSSAAIAASYYYQQPTAISMDSSTQYNMNNSSNYDSSPTPSPQATDYNTVSECCSPSYGTSTTAVGGQLTAANHCNKDTEDTTASGSPSGQLAITLSHQPNSPNESSSSPTIIVSDCQSPSSCSNNGTTTQQAPYDTLNSSPPPSSTSTNYDTSAHSYGGMVDQQYHKHYYPSVGYGLSQYPTAAAAVADSSPYISYDLSSSSSTGYCSNSYNGYSYPTNASPYAAYYSNYYSSQYTATGSQSSTTYCTNSSSTAGVSSSTYSASADGYIGYPYSNNTATGQGTSSLWNYSASSIGSSSGLSLAGQQFSKVSYDTPRFKLTPERAIPLVKWFEDHKDHPYPSRHEKMVLCQSTQLTFTQVSTWFANARRRMKKAAQEDDEDEGSMSDEEKLI